MSDRIANGRAPSQVKPQCGRDDFHVVAFFREQMGSDGTLPYHRLGLPQAGVKLPFFLGGGRSTVHPCLQPNSMINPASMTRRQFLEGSVLMAAAGAFLGPFDPAAALAAE